MHPNHNTTWQRSLLSRRDREIRNGHRSGVLWFTGLPGSGKTTLAFALEKELHDRNIASYVLDGDNVRQGLNRDLGFSEKDRTENLRRVGEVAKCMMDAGLVVLAAFISPNAKDRRMVRDLFDPDDFLEIYVKCSLEECERRDPKGLYKKARSGQIANFTGISAGYDIPESPDLVIDTERLTVGESVAFLLHELEKRNYLAISRTTS